VIADVAASGAIAQFGFREGDEIVSVSGQRVASERDFLNWLFEADVRYERVPVVVLRDARRRLIYVRPEVFVSQTAFVDPLDRFGVVLDDRYSDRIVVWRVLPRSAAYYAGIRAGDVITAFDGSRVADAGEFVRLIESTDPANVAVEISRNQQARELYVDLAIAEPAREQRTSLRPSVAQPMRMDRTFDDIQSVDPSSDRRLSPRPDVPPGTRVPGGEVGRDRGPISPTGAAGGTPTTPMRLGFPR
jgi:S1-C subfamily serine protease